MSDKTGAPRSTRGGSGAIIGGLAVGALLGTPVAASAATAAEPPAIVTEVGTTVRACQAPRIAADESVTTIREQFQLSFTAGAVTPVRTDLAPIICDPH
ncbi:hypothetical protein [Couchioplanes caeruleus]|uniref:Uncharacterized protein n=2 Tax=Couchioplanes caeruleus TaxID=56438 RepID=A0A1K0GB10_9ACTN|nr:hypothetical protein [Couchioplanes caeruleus]OJF14434.1 hypothetical protein BG844_09655 [Couchioplanes caeruleus subsp. caeruleus]ROP34019.1 hypothetical protein EDD30_7084 [Couchioplanes caeruleus]